MNILQMSISSVALILAIVIIRALLLNKLPKMTFLVLWGVALCRLLIPFSVQSRLSIYYIIERINNGLQQPAAASASAVANTAGAVSAQTSQFPLMTIWIVGMCVLALFFAATYIKCRLEFASSLPAGNGFIEQCLKEYKISKPVQIRQHDKIKAPLTYGITRPVVLLPKATDFGDSEKLCYILAHELTHIRRFDALWKLLLALTLCIHWFNPFVWVMYFLANRDIELSCDEAVVRSLGGTVKSAYAEMLINMEEKKISLTPLCSGFSKNAIEERIISIMKIKKTSLAGIMLALVLVAGTATVFATTAAAESAPSAPDQNGYSMSNTSEGQAPSVSVDGVNVSVEQLNISDLSKFNMVDLKDASISYAAPGSQGATITADQIKSGPIEGLTIVDVSGSGITISPSFNAKVN